MPLATVAVRGTLTEKDKKVKKILIPLTISNIVHELTWVYHRLLEEKILYLDIVSASSLPTKSIPNEFP